MRQHLFHPISCGNLINFQREENTIESLIRIRNGQPWHLLAMCLFSCPCRYSSNSLLHLPTSHFLVRPRIPGHLEYYSSVPLYLSNGNSSQFISQVEERMAMQPLCLNSVMYFAMPLHYNRIDCTIELGVMSMITNIDLRDSMR